MTQEQIIEGNKAIAEFMGYIYHPHPDRFALPGWKVPNDKPFIEKLMRIGTIGKRPYLCRTSKEIQFHTSWDWLMPVVEKINKDGSFKVRILFNANGTNGIYGCYIDKVEWVNNYLQDERISGYSNIENPIESVYKAIIKFINWYNEQK